MSSATPRATAPCCGADLSRILAQAGFVDIVWLMPEESGYYQPVVLAHNPGPSVEL